MDELPIEELQNILGLTIKNDNDNKIITFLCMLSAYTEGGQFNISFNAPSSAGKSYVAMEIAKLFPKEDLMEYAYASPASFFHDHVAVEGEDGVFMNDLSRKIILFLDMPDSTLLARLRPVLSHDKKIIESKITDKTEKKGMRTKKILIQGYPSVVFCSAGLKMDEQESTRLFLLSPEISQEKIEAGINQTILKEADGAAFNNSIESNLERQQLKARILRIREEHIDEIKLEHEASVKEGFMEGKNILKLRHQRDIKRFISLVKAHALLNMFNRTVENKTLYATDKDVAAILPLWNRLSKSQELSLPPYVYDIYLTVIEPLYHEKNPNELTGGSMRFGLTRKEVLEKHYKVKGTSLSPKILADQILVVLEASGLITQEPDENNRTRKLVYLTNLNPEEYIPDGYGVNDEPEELDLSDIPF